MIIKMPRMPRPRPDEPERRFNFRCQEDENMIELYDNDDVRIRKECQLIWDNYEKAEEQEVEVKTASIYSTKSSGEIKDIDNNKREIAIYLSKFDNLDSDNDIIQKGAFKKSLNERGPGSQGNRKIQFLRHHDWTKQIGVFTKLEEDESGLFAVGKLGTSSLGEDAWRDYNEGIIREHSIGYQLLTDKVKFVKDESIKGGGYNLIQEVVLFEGSAVTFGSNDLTNVVGVVKGQNKTKYIDDVSEELVRVIGALSKGQGSDERLYSLEMRAKYLTAQLKSLSDMQPGIIPTALEEQPIEKGFDWATVISKINV
jgi:HK97 family phage prohead protease